jgi:NAD(P)H-dependent flavin oxidoreductase YrpB (nitropropane dioxygenase family)
MVYAGSFDPNQMAIVFEDMRIRTAGVFGANFLIPEAFVSDLNEIREQVETASKLVKVVEFFYRQPDPSLVDLVHSGGALASWQIGSNEEAVAATGAGCDPIVAQGVEAGGARSRKGQPSDLVESGIGFCQGARASSRRYRLRPFSNRRL